MRILLPYFLVISYAISPAFAQTPAASFTAEEPRAEKKAPSDSANAKADAVPEVNPAFEMLQQAYYLGGQLPADEHAAQLGEVVIIAAKMKHPLLRQWVLEVFQLTAGLPQQGMRQSMEQGALGALAAVDPAEALRMLGQLAPATLAANQMGQVFDNRTNAARQVFPKYWKGTNDPDFSAVREAANYLGETGQYPFAAVGLILKDVSAKDAAGAESLFLDALQYYQRQQINSFQFHIEFQSLLQAAKGIVPDSMERAGIEVAVARLMIQAEEPPPNNLLYVGRTYAGNSFIEPHSIAEDTLFRLLPLVRQFEPDLEKRISEKFSHLINPVPSDLGPLPDRISYSAVLLIDPADPNARAKTIAEVTNNSRAAAARRFATTDMEAALRVADSITDPVLKTSTLLAIAPEKTMENAKQSAMVAETSGKPETQQPPDEKAQLAIFLPIARSQVSGNGVGLWDTLSHGLDFAEEMFQKAKKAAPLKVGYWMKPPDWEGPGYIAMGFDEANALIKIGMEKETANTLGWLAHDHDPALKSYLLIAAAEGLWNKQKANPAPASATPSPQQ